METFHKIAFLFPGQGAQKVGMGRDFFEHYPIARETFEEADEILGSSLSTLIFEGPSQMLLETRNSQTGIYVTSVAILRVLNQQFPDLIPAVSAGLSLGEYTALTASGRLLFKQCLPLVQSRGEYMHEACVNTQGTMAAIFGLAAEEIQILVEELHLPEDLWVANFNCPGQTVISGTLKGVEAGILAAKKRGAKRTIPLRVHGAFHSRLMRLAQDKLSLKIAPLEFLPSNVALVMNVPGDFVSNPEEIRQNMTLQVTCPVRWEQGIKAMKEIDLFLEIGPGKTLLGLNRQIVPQIKTINISTIADLETLSNLYYK